MSRQLYDAGWRWYFDGVKLKWEPRDLWVGVYWRKENPYYDGGWWGSFDIYVCLVPCFPIRFAWAALSPKTREAEGEGA